MTFEAFELSVIDLASKGVRLTVVNVAAFTRVTPTQAEAWLDDMARAGRLEVELDESQGLIYYRVRGLSVEPRAWPLAVAPIEYPRNELPPPRRGRKSPALAAIFGLCLPGVGLLYAAPLSAVVVVTLVTIAAVKMFAVLPLLGWLLSSVALGVCALGSAVLGVLYARKYNELGRRGHVHAEAKRIARQRIAQHAALLS